MSNIDEKAKNNFTIEVRIFENYEKVKHEIIKVIDFLRHAETNLGMCRGLRKSMVRIDRLREDSEKRILRCSEGKSIWYQIWIDPGDMMRIEPLLEGGNRLWCIEIQKYYVFFYEVRNGRRIIGENKIKEILNILL